MYAPLVKTLANQATLELVQSVQRHEDLNRGDGDSDSDGSDIEDPANFDTFDLATVFIAESGRGVPGGGNKDPDAIVPNR